MRARFSAYVKGETDYIVNTTHPDNPAIGGSKRNGEVVSTLRQDIQATHNKVCLAHCCSSLHVQHASCCPWLCLQLVDLHSGRAHHAGMMYGAFRQVRWLRLKVLGRDSGPGSHEDEAFVAFQTWFKFRDQQGQRQRGTRTEALCERRCASTRRMRHCLRHNLPHMCATLP
jgi:uncharacterized protein YchJ